MIAETPQEVYEMLNGAKPAFMYRVSGGEVKRVQVLHHGRTGWTRVRYANGEERNIQRSNDRWASEPLESCELWLEFACECFLRRQDDSADKLRMLKNAIELLETFDPASFDEDDPEPNHSQAFADNASDVETH